MLTTGLGILVGREMLMKRSTGDAPDVVVRWITVGVPLMAAPTAHDRRHTTEYQSLDPAWYQVPVAEPSLGPSTSC